MKQKNYQVPKRKQPFFSFIKMILRLFYRKPRIIYLDEKIADKSIIISNHCNKKGPMVLELYLPAFYVPWGAHQMLDKYQARRAYLRDIYYIQKRGYNRFLASLFASFEAIFSIFFYRGMRFLPTYPDARLARTIEKSISNLEANNAVLIFPEDSSEGYKEILSNFFPGFVILAEKYYKKTGIDLPVYPIYYHSKRRVIIVGKPAYVQEYVKLGFNRNQIADAFCQKVNDLYDYCVANNV